MEVRGYNLETTVSLCLTHELLILEFKNQKAGSPVFSSMVWQWVGLTNRKKHIPR